MLRSLYIRNSIYSREDVRVVVLSTISRSGARVQYSTGRHVELAATALKCLQMVQVLGFHVFVSSSLDVVLFLL